MCGLIKPLLIYPKRMLKPARWNNGCDGITFCVLNSGNLWSMLTYSNDLATVGFVLIYCMWHFSWHLFHLDVTLHDINSDSAERIDRYCGVVLWDVEWPDRLISVVVSSIVQEHRLNWLLILAVTSVGCPVNNLWGLLSIQWLLPRDSGHNVGWLSFKAKFILFQ